MSARTVGLSLLIEPADGFGPVYSLIASATTRVDMTMYELDDMTAERDLVADAQRGVDVRVILDREYAGGTYNQAAYAYLSRHGVAVHWGPAGTIVHQKTIVVDGSTALIATFNLADTSDYYATTRDFGVIDSNPADVASIVRVFDSDWSGAAITIPPAADNGADLVWSPGSQAELISVIDGARHSLLVENEEMDDSWIISALRAAARRGVSVDVVMTADPSWNEAFDELAAASVHVRTLGRAPALYIHAKAIVADPDRPDGRLLVGSQNFSVSSLDYNRELSLITSSPSLVDSVAATIRSDFARGQPWTS
jgi:phosphatidylserine/phosphatidylglycerophosphate/cardiolipin synthase-like enzyme